MIVLQKLTWSNLFSYGANNSIDFSNNTITQVLGENGHGKSSIVLILQEVLYGKNSKGIKKADILNRNLNTTKYNARLDFSVNNVQYAIEHARSGAKVTVSLFKEGEDISDHTATSTYKKIESLLGLNFESFCQLVYQSTDSSLEFLKATDTTRKKFLISLLNLEKYTGLEEKCKKVLSAVNTEKVQLQSSVSTIETWLNQLKSDMLTPIKLLEVPPDPENLREEIANLRNSIKELGTFKQKVDSNNQKKNKREQLLAIINKPLGNNTYFLEEITQELAEVKAESTQLEKKKKELEQVKDTCPTCKQKIQGVDIENIRNLLQEAITTISLKQEYISQLQELHTKALAYKKAKDAHDLAVKEFNAIEVDESLPDTVSDNISENLNSLEKSLKDITDEISKTRAYNSKAELHNSKIEFNKEKQQEYTNDLKQKTEVLSKIIEREARLEVLKQAFGTKGIVAYKIESMIKDLESLINKYLQEFSYGKFTINFVIQNDKLNVELTDEGKTISITALSSGELARVNTSTLLAIRKLLNSLSSNKLNLLFLDEVLNVLDEDGKQKLISLLSEETDLNSFIVSHGWYHPLIARVKVVKENGISMIQED